MNALSKLDVSKAQAYLEADRLRILEVIESDPAVDVATVNAVALDEHRSWFVRTGRVALYDILSDIQSRKAGI